MAKGGLGDLQTHADACAVAVRKQGFVARGFLGITFAAWQTDVRRKGKARETVGNS